MSTYIFSVLFSILFQIGLSQSKQENIEYLGLQNFTDSTFADMTNIQNKTYLLSPQIFNRSFSSYFIEMEVDLTNSEQDDTMIIFALSQIYSLQQNHKTSVYEADFIDKRGYYMKKKYYRISFEKSYLIEQNMIYLTILQANEEIKEFKYTLKFGVQDNKEGMKCPFDCFQTKNQGICNSNTGFCSCQKGYFDLDCSRQSLNLDFYREQSLSSPFYFTWKTTFSSQFKSAFYHQISNKLSGYLYLQIKKRDSSLASNSQLNQDSDDLVYLNIFYTSENQKSQTLSVADQYFAEESFRLTEKQLINGEEIFLEKFEQQSRNLINDQQDEIDKNSDGQIDQYILNNNLKDQNPIQLLFGFRQEPNFENEQQIIEYDIILIIKQHGPSQAGNSAILTSSTTIIIMSVILIVLIAILVVLVFYLHKRTQLINTAISTINKRKGKKEIEYSNILELIPTFKYTQEIKNSLQEGHQEEPTCPVCLCEFEIDEDIRKTYCPHHFHADCLQEWLRKQKNCPHCRNVLTPRTIKQRIENPQAIHSVDQIEGFQIIKSPKKNKDYVQQIDDVSINISKLTKKSNSPDKTSQKSISPEKSPKKSKSPDKSPKKSQSPPKSPWQSKKQELSEIITTVRPHNQVLKKKRTISSINSSKYCGSPLGGITLQKLQSLENIVDDSLKPKSETLIHNFKELIQSDYHGVTIATEVVTQTGGDRTNTNLKNRGSILSSAVNSIYESQHQMKKGKQKKNGRSPLSQILKKSESLFDIDN